MTEDSPRVVFLFDDVDVYMFPSLTTAEVWMEAVDVDADEYTAALTETGRVIRKSTEKGLVVLENCLPSPTLPDCRSCCTATVS